MLKVMVIMQVPDWRRGEEHGQIVSPRPQNMDVWALGGSISTNGPIVAEAIVVRTFDELEARKDEVCSWWCVRVVVCVCVVVVVCVCVCVCVCKFAQFVASGGGLGRGGGGGFWSVACVCVRVCVCMSIFICCCFVWLGVGLSGRRDEGVRKGMKRHMCEDNMWVGQ